MEYNNVNTNKQRDISLDIICGVLIIHMIMGHILGSFNCLSDLFWFQWESKILFFFMPWFFYKNGMFFHPKEDVKELLKRDYKRLIRPFIIWSIIGECVRFVGIALSKHDEIWQCYTASIKSIFTFGAFSGNAPLWFLLSLFLVRISFNKLIHHKQLMVITMVLSFMIPWICWKIDLNQASSITHTLTGFFYFCCGYYLKDWQSNKNVIAISGFLLFMLTILSPSMIEMSGNNVWNGNTYIFGILRALAAIILINNILPPPKIISDGNHASCLLTSEGIQCHTTLSIGHYY